MDMDRMMRWVVRDLSAEGNLEKNIALLEFCTTYASRSLITAIRLMQDDNENLNKSAYDYSNLASQMYDSTRNMLDGEIFNLFYSRGETEHGFRNEMDKRLQGCCLQIVLGYALARTIDYHTEHSFRLSELKEQYKNVERKKLDLKTHKIEARDGKSTLIEMMEDQELGFPFFQNLMDGFASNEKDGLHVFDKYNLISDALKYVQKHYHNIEVKE